MEEQGCPRCKTTKYRNPSLKLMVNVCGHTLCVSCVDLLFIRGSGACPECGTALRRSNFRLQLFEDSGVEKEVDIRRKIMKDFNKKEDDFPTLEEYNDYLEMIETIIYNLANNMDIENTKKMIEQYRKDNKDQIIKNRSKLSKDEEYLEMLIDQEMRDAEVRIQKSFQEELKERNMKKKKKEALLDELISSDMPAQFIVAKNKELVAASMSDISGTVAPKQPKSQFSTGIKIGHQDTFLPVPKIQSAPLFQYSPLVIELCGPELPTPEKMQSNGYLSNIRAATEQELGGGYRELLGCQRALQDALCGLYF